MLNNLRVTLRTRTSVKPAAVNFILQEWQKQILEREIKPNAEKKKNESGGAEVVRY
jgi:hypothetical protein